MTQKFQTPMNSLGGYLMSNIAEIDRYNDLKLILNNGRKAGTLTSEREDEIMNEMQRLWNQITKDQNNRR